MMEGLHCYIEGEVYSESIIPKHFISRGYFSEIPENKYILKVCGIANHKKNDYIFFPKGYGLDQYKNNDHRKNAQLLFKSLLKYKETVRLTEEEIDWLGDSNSEMQYLNTITWLIKDYLAYGLYVVNERQSEKNGNGRIDWERTIKKGLPFMKNNKFVYVDLVTSRNSMNQNSLIKEIHESVILQCIRDFGWLYGVTDRGKQVELNLTIDKQVIVLKKKLRETFSGRQIRLLQYLIAYLEKKTGEDLDLSLVTPYFYTVWEEMLQNMFEHNEELNKLVPKPYWQIEGSKKPKYTRQIPDILVKHKGSLIILDAKYYSIRSGNLSKFPGWESVVKQLYYNLSLKNEHYEHIKNIFIMPESLFTIFKFIGHTGVEGKEKEFGYVQAFSIDIHFVLDSYTRNMTQMTVFNSIVDFADEKTKELNERFKIIGDPTQY